jgi:hypothetical protein
VARPPGRPRGTGRRDGSVRACGVAGAVELSTAGHGAGRPRRRGDPRLEVDRGGVPIPSDQTETAASPGVSLLCFARTPR